MLNIKSYKNICFNILILIIIGWGIFLRTSLYFKQVPFWYDEQILGSIFFDINIFKFFCSLSDVIKIPPLWGIINQVFLNIFGHSFLTFRFISFISGISTIVAFFFLLKNLFKDKIAVLTGLLLFSFNPWLIYYSSEFRPYSSDVLVCILLLLSFKFICFKNISFRKIILYTLISMGAILFSFPAMFIIPALILAKCIEEKHFNPKILFIFAGVCSACLYLYLIDRDCYKFMVIDWGNIDLSGFFEPSFSSFNLLINNFLNYVFWIYISFNLFILKFFIITGLLFFFLNKQKEAFIFLFIFLFAISASFLKLYPFSQRVCLYLIPVILILISKIIDFPDLNKKNILIPLKSVLIAGVIIYLTSFHKLYNVINIISMVPIEQRYNFYNFSKKILNKVNNEDVIILPTQLEGAIRFYNNFLKENKNIKIIKYNNHAIDKEEAERVLLKTVLDSYDYSSTIWILGKYDFSWDISPDNINIVEDELKKHNLEYTKTDDGYLYTFKVNK